VADHVSIGYMRHLARVAPHDADRRHFASAADLIEAQQAEIERLRNLLDAVVEEFNPSCHCDHYPRHDCPCARVRRMLDGLGLPSTNHPEEARRG
jgi:hypothetical protein